MLTEATITSSLLISSNTSQQGITESQFFAVLDHHLFFTDSTMNDRRNCATNRTQKTLTVRLQGQDHQLDGFRVGRRGKKWEARSHIHPMCISKNDRLSPIPLDGTCRSGEIVSHHRRPSQQPIWVKLVASTFQGRASPPYLAPVFIRAVIFFPPPYTPIARPNFRCRFAIQPFFSCCMGNIRIDRRWFSRMIRFLPICDRLLTAATRHMPHRHDRRYY